MIQVEGFSKIYGETLAVDDLSFEVEAGAILGLVGPNGAGKTTTLRAIGGIFPPTSGTVRIDGHNVVEDPILAKRKLAIIPDTANLFESLTVWEHLEFTAQVHGLQAWQNKAGDLLEELDMTENREKLAGALSHGMKQKVAVSCAFLHEPLVLLLDEPLTGLDPRGIRTLYESLRQRAANGAAIILSSHLLSQIEPLCSRFLILQKGRRVLEGSKEDIRADLPSLREDASLEDIFFEVTERDVDDADTEVPETGSSSDESRDS